MFKNSQSICYIFFAIDDVILTSVNTYRSMMGISTEDKCFIKSLRENKKYGAKWLLKLFPNKNWSVDGLKALIKKIDNTDTVPTMRGRPLPNTSNNSICVVNFFWSALSVHQDCSFYKETFKQSLYSIFLIFWQRFDQVHSVLIPIIDVYVLTDVTIASSVAKNM